MSLQNLLTVPPTRQRYPVLFYSVLITALLLFAFSIWVFCTTPATYHHDRYMGLVVSIMLLSNELAFQVRWQPILTAALRIFSLVWMIFSFFYIFYWSNILFK